MEGIAQSAHPENKENAPQRFSLFAQVSEEARLSSCQETSERAIIADNRLVCADFGADEGAGLLILLSLARVRGDG